MAFTNPIAQKLLITQDTVPPPAYVQDPIFQIPSFDFEDPDADEDSESLSSIHLRINAPLTVKGDNNLIAVDAALSASKIAVAIVGALKQMSVGEHGIPMIDENGRPRPVKIEVRAETAIEGGRNVVGEKAVLAATLSSGAARKNEISGNGAGGSKRRRAESEPLEAVKRIRTE